MAVTNGSREPVEGGDETFAAPEPAFHLSHIRSRAAAAGRFPVFAFSGGRGSC